MRLRMTSLRCVLASFLAASAVVIACGSDDEASSSSSSSGGVVDAGPRGVEPAGQACTAATQCCTGLDGGAVVGTVTCLDKVPNGYCTHTCTQDSDCCATPGECRIGIKQVCSPFTNDSSTKDCFVSCEDADIRAGITASADAGGYDGGAADGGVENAYCLAYASVYATCRSSGGGNQNRKVCIPQQ